MKTIVIIARRPDWEQARRAGTYTHSTVESTLAEVGFLHCTFPDQTMDTVNRKYRKLDDLMLLLVDTSKVKAPIKYEAALSGRAGTFPHIYGPLNIGAVYATVELTKDDQGRFTSPRELIGTL